MARKRDSELRESAEAVRAQELVAQAKARITRFRRLSRARPDRPALTTCACGTEVFKAWPQCGSKDPVILEWADADEALDAVWGWEVELRLEPSPSDPTADLQWVCVGVRNVEQWPQRRGEPDPWRAAAERLDAPRYQPHSEAECQRRIEAQAAVWARAEPEPSGQLRWAALVSGAPRLPLR